MESAATSVGLVEMGGSNLYGREREMATVRRVFDRVQAGGSRRRGAVVLLGGASGVGKTALATHVIEDAVARGYLVYRAACEPFHEGMSFFPIRELIRQLGDDKPVGELIADVYGPDSVQADMAAVSDSVTADPTSRREALVATFTNILFGKFQQAQAPPVLLFLDDLEHLDVGSADALICLVSRLHEGPVVLMGAYRSDLVTRPSHALRKVISTARRAENVLTSVDLDGFDDSTITSLVEIMLEGETDLPHAFYKKLNGEAEGNPLFIREVLRALRAPQPDGTPGQLRQVNNTWRFHGQIDEWAIPPTVEDVIATRLSLLDAEQRGELEFAAVIGRRFAFEVFQNLVSQGEDELLGRLEQYLNFDLIREIDQRDDTFEFSHGKIRDVLYGSLSGLRKRRIHASVAEVLQALEGTTNEDWDALIGEHLFLAAKHAAAFPYLLRAARNARQTGMVKNAADLFRKVLTSSDGAIFEGDDSRQSILLELAGALVLASETDDAASVLETLVQDHVPVEIRAEALNYLGDALLFEGHVDQALEKYEMCESLAEHIGDRRLLCEVACDLAELHGRQYEHLAGLDTERAGRSRSRYVAYVERAYALSQEGHGLGGVLEARALRNKAKLSRVSEDLETAERLYRRAIASLDGRVSGHRFLIPLAKTLRLQGKSREALECIDRIQSWNAQVGSTRSEAIAWQYRATILMAEVGADGPVLLEARRAADRSLRLHRMIGYAQGTRETQILLGEIAFRRGRDEEALAHFRAVVADASLTPTEVSEVIARELDANGETDRADHLRSFTGRAT